MCTNGIVFFQEKDTVDMCINFIVFIQEEKETVDMFTNFIVFLQEEKETTHLQ